MAKDPSKRRYKISGEIGAGSYATVYGALDTKLNREVAIKQLHPQFLSDKEQLERYWQEAQLLGALEHPNVMNIFDVIKKRGCLVLERMQGSLKSIYGNKPMPIQDVRQVLLQASSGLKCIHDNGIIHGDIKPTNLFLNKQDVVKLGDFGLARRVNNDEGSLIKGTTRYMAPELVDEKFGDVGPPSDLYSLGFSALEMLVGPQFDSLFPDLIAFGRDRQMAWMMWHCSADRTLPPVQSILAGVPDDLANVIQKLTSKDQTQRYKSADQVIADLQADNTVVGQSLRDDASAAEEEARRKKKRMRIIAAAASLLSVALCCAILFWPKPKEVVQPDTPPDVNGIVRNVLEIDEKLVLIFPAGDTREFKIADGDSIKLNRIEHPLRDLKPDDRVVVHTRFELSENGKYDKFFDISAFRPESHTGVIAALNPGESKFTLTVTEGVESGKQFELTSSADMPISLNNMERLRGKPIVVSDLAEGDQVIVDLSDSEEMMLALSVEATRVETLKGFLRKIDRANRVVTVALQESDEDQDSFVRIQLEKQCTIKLNDVASINEKLLSLRDLEPGDKVTLEHDIKVRSIDAYRVFYDQGEVLSVDADVVTIRNNAGNSKRYRLPKEMLIPFGDEKIGLADLRRGDRLSLSHDSPDAETPSIDTIEANRPSDNNKWAILIANENFEDSQIQTLPGAVSGLEEISRTLTNRYGVPEKQLLICKDFGVNRLQTEVAQRIRAVPPNAELYVYLSTRAFGVKRENVFLATKDSVFTDMKKNPFTLNWLIDSLDECATKTKLLLLDCTPSDASTDPLQRSSSGLIEITRSVRRGGYPRSVYVLGSCDEGQVGASENGVSLFAKAIANGFAGQADESKDNALEITELTDFVKQTVVRANSNQSPLLVLPDSSPPRISDRAKAAILNLLTRFSESELDLDAVAREAESADRLAGGQPEPMTALGVLLIKARKMDRALTVLDAVRIKHPEFVPAHRAATWLNFYKSRYDEGFDKLTLMMEQMPTLAELDGEPYSKETLEVFYWAGQLRQLAQSAEWNKRLPPASAFTAYDQQVATFGEQAATAHQQGRAQVKKVIAQFASELAANPESRARLERTRLRSYMPDIDNESMINSLKATLDQ